MNSTHIFKGKKTVYLLLILLVSTPLFSQETPEGWHLLNNEKDYPGINLKKAYKLLKKNKKKATPVLVAVLDSGVDIAHEDLKSLIWINTNEIPNNGLDDDDNGYVDDVNGWNFIGGKDGESVKAETLEFTRLYRKYKILFENKTKFNIKESEREEYKKFLHYMKKFNDGKEKLAASIKSNKSEYDFFVELVPPLQELMGKKIFSAKELKRKRLKKSSSENLRAKFFNILERNKKKDLTSEKLIDHYEGLSSKMETLKTRLEFNYSLDFDGRAIIGDDPLNLKEKNYGNGDVTERAEHGTHVAGIIGAVRKNKKGMDGIANNVIIMPIRSVPMGDEKDKDIANGIRYAVDNGARIINMSFGKNYSPNEKYVNDAVLYAKEKGVLLVHAAGNDNKDTNYYYNYPTALMLDGSIASNWIEVGAIAPKKDKELVAEFSNYGNFSIDIFAPGVDIYSTIPDNKYKNNSGTSMAAPVVSGVAALLLSHFPDLTPEQIIEIIIESGVGYDINVNTPGTEEQVPFNSLSKSGKVVNAYQAIKLALEKQNEK